MGLKPEGYEANDYLRMAQRLQDGIRFWQRGMVYKDTIGITNPHQGLIDVRRHDDTEGNTVLLVDNYQNLTGLSVSFGGAEFSLSPHLMSAIVVPSAT
jgi:hypothetical protein